MSTTVDRITNTSLIGPLAVTIAIVAVAAANFTGNGENGGAAPFAVSAVIVIALGVFLFGRAVPRALEGKRPARIALALATVSVLTLFAFWSGLPQILAPAAIVLGLAAPRSGESVAAVVIATAAYALSLVGAAIG
jgi:hypothetical protein